MSNNNDINDSNSYLNINNNLTTGVFKSNSYISMRCLNYDICKNHEIMVLLREQHNLCRLCYNTIGMVISIPYINFLNCSVCKITKQVYSHECMFIHYLEERTRACVSRSTRSTVRHHTCKDCLRRVSRHFNILGTRCPYYKDTASKLRLQ